MRLDRNDWAQARAASNPLSMVDLRIQVAPDGPATEATHRALGARPFAEGVIHYLVLRTESGTRPISTDEIERLGWNTKEAWSSAWALTRTMERPTDVNVIHTGRAPICHLYSAHEFGASFVPFLDDALCDGHRMPGDGAIVSMPMRRSVLVHPIRGGEVIEAIQAMIPITRQMHQTGPDSVSAHAIDDVI